MQKNKVPEKIAQKYRKKPGTKSTDKSLSSFNPVVMLVKISTWIKLALVPVFIAVVIGAIVIYNSNLTWSDPVMLFFPTGGAIAGIVFATKIAKRHSLEEIAYKDIASSDIDDLTHPKKTDEKSSN